MECTYPKCECESKDKCIVEQQRIHIKIKKDVNTSDSGIGPK